MNGFLLDTNCISELVRLRPEPNVIRWLERTDEQSLHLSVLTLGEIRKGIVQVEPGQRRARLDAWLTTELQKRFAGRILSIDAAVADQWGILIGAAKRTVPVIDSLLAATAWHYKLTIVSRNIADFQLAQVAVLDPWQPLG